MKKILLIIMVIICAGCGFGTDKDKDVKNENISKVEQQKITTASYKDIEFKPIYSDQQINITITNVSDKDVNINTLTINIYDKNGRTNKYDIPLNLTLKAGEETMTTLAYKIEDIKEIEFTYN